MTESKKYRALDHTADLRLEIYGRDEKELFANACFALFDHIVHRSCLIGEEQIDLTVTGTDTADLMFNWLRELLAMWTVENRLISSSRITALSDTRLCARLRYDRYVPGRQRLKSDVKAVTYHDLTIAPTSRGRLARIVFDL